MRRIIFCVFMLATVAAHADIQAAASGVEKAAMVSNWMQGINEVDQVGMAAIWRQVINGDDGLVVKAVLTGAMAAKIRDTTGSPGPYQATVTRVKKYSAPGCARIRTVYLFPEANTINGGHEDAIINYEQDICLRGYMVKRTINVIDATHNGQKHQDGVNTHD